MIKVSEPVCFVDVKNAGLTDATITIIKRTLLANANVNLFMAGDIYEINEWRVRVDILDNTPEWKQLEELAQACSAAGASFFRLVNAEDPVKTPYPGLITMNEAEDLAKIAVVLADRIWLVACFAAKKGFEYGIDLCWKWAVEYTQQKESSTNYDGWTDNLIAWMEERIRKYHRGEG